MAFSRHILLKAIIKLKSVIIIDKLYKFIAIHIDLYKAQQNMNICVHFIAYSGLQSVMKSLAGC